MARAGRRGLVGRWWWVGVALVVFAVGAVVWRLWPSPAAPEPARAREYVDFTACLLTDDRGTTGPAAAPVWAGLREASAATRARVRYLSVSGPQTVENASPSLVGLAQGCDLVFAVDDAPVAAVARGAGRFPNVRFFVVGGGVSAGNVSRVDGAHSVEVAGAVSRLVVAAVPTTPAR